MEACIVADPTSASTSVPVPVPTPSTSPFTTTSAPLSLSAPPSTPYDNQSVSSSSTAHTYTTAPVSIEQGKLIDRIPFGTEIIERSQGLGQLSNREEYLNLLVSRPQANLKPISPISYPDVIVSTF